MKDTHKLLLGVFLILVIVIMVVIIFVPLLDELEEVSGINNDKEGPDMFDPSAINSSNALDYLEENRNNSGG